MSRTVIKSQETARRPWHPILSLRQPLPGAGGWGGCGAPGDCTHGNNAPGTVGVSSI